MNANDWIGLVDQEEGQLLAASLIEEIIQKSQDVLFERHIESQVLPYAVQFTKETLLAVIEVSPPPLPILLDLSI
jgi:hypothetical protein